MKNLAGRPVDDDRKVPDTNILVARVYIFNIIMVIMVYK